MLSHPVIYLQLLSSLSLTMSRAVIDTGNGNGINTAVQLQVSGGSTALQRRQDVQIDSDVGDILGNAWLYRFPPWHEPYNPEPSNLIFSELPIKEIKIDHSQFFDQNGENSGRSILNESPLQEILSRDTETELQENFDGLIPVLPIINSDSSFQRIRNANGARNLREISTDSDALAPTFNLQHFARDLPKFPNLYHNIIRVPKFDPLPLERHAPPQIVGRQLEREVQETVIFPTERSLIFHDDNFSFSESRNGHHINIPRVSSANNAPVIDVQEAQNGQISPRNGEETLPNGIQDIIRNAESVRNPRNIFRPNFNRILNPFSWFRP